MPSTIFKLNQIIRYGTNPDMIARIDSSHKHFHGTVRTYFIATKLRGGFITVARSRLQIASLEDLANWEQCRTERENRDSFVAANISRVTGSI